MHRVGLLATLAFLWAGCVLPEPITLEPPPSNPDQAPVIATTNPLQRQVHAEEVAGQCTISLGLPEVEDPSGATLTARVFLNDGNPELCTGPLCPPTYQPLATEGSTDFQLEVANQDHPQLLQLPTKTFDLSLYQAYLVPPSEASSGLNYVEIVVSDGFIDSPTDFRDPAQGKSAVSTFWYVDLSKCAGLFP